MNTTPLKNYAPQARKAFIAAVTAQAARLGISAKEVAQAEVRGDVLLVKGQAFPKSFEGGRQKLVEQVKAQGFEPTMDRIAYTWFNRLVAIRYMELHNYLGHGYRVLSDPQGSKRPEILDHAAEVDLPGLDRAKVVELKLDGTKDEELYRMLLKAQCHALHKAMPFLFDPLGSETELLLPANLLHTDSLICQLVEAIEESAWEQIEIIGWLYQFYISEKKDQVIGKVVKSEDIPAATQLFTPNWIVKYMVQNSLGAQWLATYPHSPLKNQMEYYIEPAEQTEEVKAQLAAITPDSLNPEELTLIDPACGSGHILVEAYDLFKAIYLERGYRERDAAKLILTKNLYGLDIDPRAAQLTGFALMMKARADDRRLFTEPDIKLNVMAMVNSDELDIGALTNVLNLKTFGLTERDLLEFKKLFEHATTFGSLIQVPQEMVQKLLALKNLSEASSGKAEETTGDLFAEKTLENLGPLVRQAELLAAQYDNVVANPPYMGSKGMNSILKKHLSEYFPFGKRDLYGSFIERATGMGGMTGAVALVTMQSWMFTSSFQSLRRMLLRTTSITNVVQMSTGVMGIAFGTAVTVLRNLRLSDYIGSYSSVATDDLNAHGIPAATISAVHVGQNDFKLIPGSPIAYWVSQALRHSFKSKSIGDFSICKQGLATGDNDRFLRCWTEVSITSILFSRVSYPATSSTARRWVPYSKGGPFRKWYGNNEFVVNWAKDGTEIQNFKDELGNERSRFRGASHYFAPALTWSLTSSSAFGCRFRPAGFVYDINGMSLFSGDESFVNSALQLLNTKVAKAILKILNPTMAFQAGDIASIPFVPLPSQPTSAEPESTTNLREVALAREDWNAYERSWDFQAFPLLSQNSKGTLESSYTSWVAENQKAIAEMKRLEEQNNCLFIEAYGLQDELSPEVPIDQITLTVNPTYRYGVKGTEEERQTRFRGDTMQELVSYAVGCMMGRYSLDEPGLIYAHSGNLGFDPSRYSKFPADEDGILPLTDTPWFEGDATERLVEFLSVAWDSKPLEENLRFLADNLAPKKNEAARETLRRYLCDKFFKDHLQTYKKRPIYWLFTSGKQKAFQGLVYLHRYHEGTLARMRSEYVIPLQGKMAARLAHLEDDKKSASAAQQKRLDKEAEKLKKQQVELLAFDEKLRHYADRRIALDLDDGVKVNYGKFGTLLAEARTVHGQEPEGP